MTTNSRPTTDAPRTARDYVRPTAITLLVLALIGGLVLWSQPPQLDPGDQIRGGSNIAVNETEHFAVLPGGGRMRLELGTVDSQEDGGATYSAEGGRLVRVEWRTEPAVGDPLGDPLVWPGASAAARREPPVRVLLRVGDRTYPVVDDVRTSTADGSVTTRVAGTGDLGVAVLSGDRELRVTPTEPERSRTSRGGSPVCDPERAADEQTVQGVQADGVRCELRTARGAWVAGLGWAPAGQEWLVVRGTVRTDDTVGRWEGRPEARFTYYRASAAPTLRLTVPGARQQRVASDAEPGSAVGGATTPTTAFLVPSSSDVDVTLTVTLRAEKTKIRAGSAPDPAAPRSVTFTLRQGVRSAGLQ